MKIYTSVRLRRGWGDQKKSKIPSWAAWCLTQTVLVVDVRPDWHINECFPLEEGQAVVRKRCGTCVGFKWVGYLRSALAITKKLLLSEDQGKGTPLLNSETILSRRSDRCQGEPTISPKKSLSPMVLPIQFLSILLAWTPFASGIIIQTQSQIKLSQDDTWLELS